MCGQRTISLQSNHVKGSIFFKGSAVGHNRECPREGARAIVLASFRKGWPPGAIPSSGNGYVKHL